VIEPRLTREGRPTGFEFDFRAGYRRVLTWPNTNDRDGVVRIAPFIGIGATVASEHVDVPRLSLETGLVRTYGGAAFRWWLGARADLSASSRVPPRLCLAITWSIL